MASSQTSAAPAPSMHGKPKPAACRAADIGASLLRPAIGTLLFGIVTNLLALVVPIYMLQVYDRVLTSYSIETLVLLTVIALGLIALLTFIDHIRGRVIARAAFRAEQMIGPQLLAVAARDHLAGRSDANMPLRDLVTLRSFATGPVLTAAFDLPVAPLYVLVTFLLHPALGTIALIGVVVMVALAFANQWLTGRQLKTAGDATTYLLHTADQQTRNADTIEAMGLHDAIQERWR